MSPPVAQIGETVQTNAEVTEIEWKNSEVTVEWKICDFFSLSSKADDCYSSPSFSFAGSEWCLWLYPNSKAERLGFHICRMDEFIDSNKTIIYTFGIKCADEVKEMGEHEDEFSPKYEVWGFSSYWTRDQLRNEASTVMPDNVLTITCRLKYSEPNASKVSSSRRVWEVSRNMKRVLADGKWSDFTLKLGDRKWPVHKVILESRCKYFENMFRSEWAENTVGEVTFEDMEEDTLANVLNFIYTGCVEDMSVSNVCYIYTAAQMFLLDDLKTLCIEYMKEEMCLEILFDVLVIADTFGEEDLHQSAIEYFMLEEDKIFDSKEWKNFKMYHGYVAADLLEAIAKKRKEEANERMRLVSGRG